MPRNSDNIAPILFVGLFWGIPPVEGQARLHPIEPSRPDNFYHEIQFRPVGGGGGEGGGGEGEG
eukprot:1122197-Pyramimonas_sp.AAC.1